MAKNPTPMLSQYHSIKKQYPDCILFFRLGDFYEMFFDDALKASPILDVVLTSRGKDTSGKIPMCGVPYHAGDTYIAKLIKAGLKVAICEQTEDPALAEGIVKREVVRVISSGTYIDESNSDPRYLLCLNPDKKGIGLAFIDASSGTIQTNYYPDIFKAIELVSTLPIYECVHASSAEETAGHFFNHPLLKNKHVLLSPAEDWLFNYDIARKSLNEHFHTHSLKGFGIEDIPQAVAACGALLEYMKQMNKHPLRHIDKIALYADTEFVFISPAACHGLELERLLSTIDYTLTALGKRMLRYWLYHPLKNAKAIIERQSAVTYLIEKKQVREELEPLLKNIPDVEKNLSRISCGYTSAKDFLALRMTLNRIPGLRRLLDTLERHSPLFLIHDVPDIRALLDEAINPDLSLSNPEGTVIRQGYHTELDALRDIQEHGRQWLKNLQAQEIKRTGINSLKLGFTSVFGYYIEVSTANLKSVPQDYIRKQTLVNAERFITPALKEFEEKMLSADEKVKVMEREILKRIENRILENVSLLHTACIQIATLDTLQSLSRLALEPGYQAPRLHEHPEIDIKEGRHPVVERILGSGFIPNDTFLDCTENQLIILTGPNMAGKSTYIRQIALLVILAQIGSYIPASSASIGVVDKIFTRIGAHDEISRGQSTFMVEMSECAEILNNLTPRSLVILDEIGRGTSTYDGFSLAWAIAEYLRQMKARTLFATHFHELTALAQEFPGIKNYNVAVKKWKDEIVFLHKIMPGGTDESYGIYVARLAGIPDGVIERAKHLLLRLELHGNLHEKVSEKSAPEKQYNIFSDYSDPVLKKIRESLERLEVNALTPIEALNKLQEWKDLLTTYEQSTPSRARSNQ